MMMAVALALLMVTDIPAGIGKCKNKKSRVNARLFCINLF